VVGYDQSDFERARWVWQRRPQRRFSARFWLWLACILAPAVAAPFLHLPHPFGDVLLDASFVSGCVLVFFSSRELVRLDEWARWRADYSRAIDQLLSAPSQSILTSSWIFSQHPTIITQIITQKLQSQKASVWRLRYARGK
jgi:hypothetical protein